MSGASQAARRARRKVSAEIRRQALKPANDQPDIVDEAERERRRIRTAEAVPVIDRYKRRGEITDEQHRAAERLWSDFVRSGFNPWARSFAEGGGGFGPKTPGMGPRAVEYNQAMQAVGITLSPVLVHVVIYDNPLEGGMTIEALRIALDRLYVHYWGE